MENQLKDKISDDKLGRAVIAGVVALYLIGAIGTGLTKQPFNDEGWLASPGLNLITKGHMGTSALDPAGTWLTGIDKHTYWVMPLYPLNLAVWYKIFGFSALSMRALSTFWGLVALASWFLIARALSGNSRLALLAFTFVAFDFNFMITSAVGRMDMMSASLGFAALAAYLSLRERKFKLAVFVSHTLSAASFFTHPYGGVALGALVLVTLYFDRARTRSRDLLLGAVPYLIGIAGWSLYILQNPAAFIVQFTGNANASERFALLGAPWSAIRAEITGRYLDSYGLGPDSGGLEHLKAVVLVAYAVALLSILFSRRIRLHKGYRALLILTGLYFLMLTFVEGKKSSLYLIYVVPFFATLLAVWIHWCWTKRRFPAGLLMLAASGLVVLQFSGVLYLMKRNDYENKYMPAVNFVKSQSDAETLVLGPSELAFELGFRENFVDDFHLGYYSGKKPDLIVVDASYRDRFEWFRDKKPQVYQHINNLLTTEYTEIYHHASFEVYARK